MASFHKTALLCSAAVLAMPLAVFIVGPAWADGGSGGGGGFAAAAGAGGAASTIGASTAGHAGENATGEDFDGGGGGGGGLDLNSGTGGSGGVGGNNSFPGFGSTPGGVAGSGGAVGSSTPTVNSSTVTGGTGGPGQEGAVVPNGNDPFFGGGGGGGGGGGFGLLLAATGSASNITGGVIVGGIGGAGGEGEFGGGGGGGGNGGGGVLLSSGIGYGNVGALQGGSGGAGGDSDIGVGGDGGDGGMGAALTGDGAISNIGTIIGGTAGNGGALTDGESGENSGNGGSGGAGVLITANGTIDNQSGTISGGTGGAGGNNSNPGTVPSGNGGDGGTGGDGVMMLSGGSLVNESGATINGGNGGGAGTATHGGQNGTIGAGGAGIRGADITVVNSGTISGGTGNGGQADAVDFTGGTNTLTLQTGSALNGNVEIDGSGSVTFNQSTAQTLDNIITGTGSVIQDGTGTLTLTGVNSYSGGTTVEDGSTLAVFNDSNLGNAAGALTLNNSTLQADGSFSTARSVVLINASVVDTNGFNVALSGPITAGNTGTQIYGTLVKEGAGTLSLSGANSFEGATLDAGTLALVGSGSLGSYNVLSMSAGSVFDISQTTDGAAILTLRGAGAVALGGQTLTAGDGGTNSTFSGSIADGGIAGGSEGKVIVTGFGGEIVLTGVNTYTGGTEIASGTLALSGTGSLYSGGAVTVDAGGSFDISGLTASGTAIGNLAGGGDVNLGAKALTINQTGNTIFFGGLNGIGGSVLKNGTGMLILSGANTYTGATNVSAGTLFGGAANAFSAASTTNVAIGGTLDLGTNAQTINTVNLSGGTIQNGTLTSANDIASVGGTINGIGGSTGVMTLSGTTTLRGTNRYTGATSVDGGTLIAGAANAFSAASATSVGTLGTLDLGGEAQTLNTVHLAGGTIQSGTLTSANGITSTGGTIDGIGGSTAVTVNRGTTTLLGANSYSGGSTINGGTLAVGAGGSLFPTGFVNLAGSSTVFDVSAAGKQTIGALSAVAGSNVSIGVNSLTFGDATNTVLGGGFTGTGSLIKQGAGMVTLNGDAAVFAGTSTVAAGTLEVGDAVDPGAVLGGDVDVASGGTLRGHGTIGGDVVSDGVVAPGGSIGILFVGGNFTQNSGGLLNIEITPSTVAGTGYSQLQVTGSASLAGALAVQVDSGTYSVGSVYDILHAAGGVTGSFATSNFDPALAAYITPQVHYAADDVLLELTPTPTPPITPTAPTTPGAPTAPVPPAAPVNYSNSLAFSSGRIYVASNFAQDNAVFSVIASPLSGATPGAADASNRGYWLHGLGSFGQANGYDINEQGFIIGKGFQVSPDLIVGGAVSNVYTSTNGGGSSATGNSFGALVYGIYNFRRVTVSSSFGIGHLGTDSNRGLPTLGETAHAASNGTYEAAALKFQYDLLSSTSAFITPYATASYLHTGLGSAVETGAGILDLRYGGMSTSLGEFGAGMTAGLNLPVKYGMLTPWVQLGGTGTLGNPHIRDAEVLGTFSAGETALAAPVGAFTPALGLALKSNKAWSLTAAWGGQFGSAASVENLSLEGRYVW